MRKYISFFRMRFINGLQYRAAAWAGVSTQFAWGGMTLLMFWAFYQDGKNIFPMTFPELSSYIWLQQALLALYMAWYFDNDIFDSITSGNISYELCRPADLYTMWFVKNTAVRVSRAVLRCFPILIVAIFLPRPFNISMPDSAAAGAAFAVSMILGMMILVAFSMLIYISAFYTVSSMGTRILATSVVEFFSGAVIPLPFFPDSLQKVMLALPFASIQNTPFQIYNGYISGIDIIKSMSVQIVWIAVLVAAGRLLINQALKKTVVQGG